MEYLKFISVSGLVLAMTVGLLLIFARLKAEKQGFGPNSLLAISIIIFVPGIFILAITTEFKTETLAVLLGTVAGYTLSYSKQENS
jgi:xanthine/uracil permease